MKITIREATADDTMELAALTGQLGYAMSVEDTLQNLQIINRDANEIIRVAMYEQKVVGWIHVFLAVRLESASFCEIGGLVVDEQFRRMGIARQLIDHVKPWCAGKGTAVLRVRSNVKRLEAHRFYLQCGFSEIKQQTVFEINTGSR